MGIRRSLCDKKRRVLKKFKRANFTSIILIAFVLSFIILMLADSQPEHIPVQKPRVQRSKTLHKLEADSSLLGNVYITLRQRLYRAAEKDSAQSDDKSFGIQPGQRFIKPHASRNWTKLLDHWQKGVKRRNYKYLINNESLCEGLREQKMVVLVYSATNNFKKRASLRKTWADPRITSTKRFSVVFLLGTTEDRTQQALIEGENEKYRDIAQGDFLDSYQNLTHKGLFGFQWVMDFCQNAHIVLKVDDDVFIHIFRILDTIGCDSPETGQIACQVREIGNSPILREGRWKLDGNLFPGKDFYPFRHCNGYFVMMSLDVVEQILEASVNEPHLWIDDVYLYGVLANKLNLNMIQLKNVLSLYEHKATECFNDVKSCPLLTAYTYNKKTVERLWKLSLMNSFCLTEKYSDISYVLTKLVSSL